MIVVTATVQVHPDKAKAYEAAFRELAPRIRATQPGILFYQLAKSVDVPNSYKAIEVYRDKAAMRAHVESDLLKAAMPDVYACMVGEPKIEVFHTVD